ncbi:MAG: hypothetical protein JXA74_12535 [Anaerolineae bacterium]|nr:hypothetical protein [Anaerolineae bacterium]
MAPATDTPAAELPSPARTSEAQQPATPTSAFTTTAMATLTSTPTATSTLTATPTPALHVTAVPSPATSRCAGLVGGLEIQVLVGPAEAVGLEPVAVGSVPFAVTASAPPYLVEGQAPISYEDILVQEWGTYAVTMDLDMAVQGECSGESGSEQLELVLEMAGEQLVVVDAPRFHGEYPWSGTQSLNLAFPLEEGATAQGEGWTVVLHLGSP